ncbi:MAG TPA: hypothetical protein VHM30_06395 [Gemmatimonadaceae bacterium]|nr:hypothetical protein [Gemmatimonadaceae bacterium]
MRARARHGFALLAALALLVTISIVALELDVAARPRRLAAAGATERVSALAAATAGVEHARAMLVRLDPHPPGRLTREATPALDPWGPADGMVIGPVALEGMSYRAELRDPYARLPLNAAGEDQLRRLLIALRIDAHRADMLAQAIADWRDQDQLRRANGAERAEYLRERRPLVPDDGPFAELQTLRFVMGMTDSLFRAVEPYLTTVGDGGVNLNSAPRPVLLALPGMTVETVGYILRERAAGRRITDIMRLGDRLSPGARQQLRAAMPLLRNVVTLETRELLVTSDGWRPGGGTMVRVEALISRNAEDRVVWQRVLP